MERVINLYIEGKGPVRLAITSLSLARHQVEVALLEVKSQDDFPGKEIVLEQIMGARDLIKKQIEDIYKKFMQAG